MLLRTAHTQRRGTSKPHDPKVLVTTSAIVSDLFMETNFRTRAPRTCFRGALCKREGKFPVALRDVVCVLLCKSVLDSQELCFYPTMHAKSE